MIYGEPIYTTLDNGLRLVIRQAAGSPAEICGLAVNAGSRDEEPGSEGLAHLVEHTIFKGTQRRRARHINVRMEAVGGELNAYTTKEETYLYSIFPSGNLRRALDLIADLVTGSRFPADEVEREREVVCDEIDSYLDTPSEGIFDDFEEHAFKGSALSHNILGTRSTVMTLDGHSCRRFLERFYTPGRMVFFYQGPESPHRVERLASRYLNCIDRKDTPSGRTAPPQVAPFDITTESGLHQAHTVIGARLPGLKSPMRLPLELLTNIIGGPGMNSLLNVALREKRGLVYTVDASSTFMTDTGLLTIYMGCDRNDLTKCRRIVSSILGRIAGDSMSATKLEAAKKQFLGQITVGGIGFESAALSTARSVLHFGRAASPGERRERIMAITSDNLREAAALTAPACCSVLSMV